MDRPRTDQRRRRQKLWFATGAVATALIATTLIAARLDPAAPEVRRDMVQIDTVKQGAMLRAVRGLGTLLPEDTRWITARTEGRIDEIILRPGAVVKPDDVILVLSNPKLERDTAAAASQLQAAESELVNLKVQLQREVLVAESDAASATAEYEKARLRADVHEKAFRDGAVSELDRNLSKVTAAQALIHSRIEKKRFAFAQDSVSPQLAVKAAEVERLRTQAKLLQDELNALQVRAGMNGVVQSLPVEVGSQVNVGANLARVANPERLKAQIRIAETQAKDVQIGQPAQVDTRNGLITGIVSRVDPAVLNGTVAVDVRLTAQLPRGARPDLSVEGTIELERLDNVVLIHRPVFGQEDNTVGIFRLDANGAYAKRTPVKLGRGSVNTIEVVDGLRPGDRVILSDMSQWDSHDRIRLN